MNHSLRIRESYLPATNLSEINVPGYEFGVYVLGRLITKVEVLSKARAEARRLAAEYHVRVEVRDVANQALYFHT